MQIRQAAAEAEAAAQTLHGKLWAVLIAAVVFGGIATVLRQRGPRISSLACLYVAALVAIALAMRELMRPPLNYRYPACITVLHYLFTWAFCVLYSAWRKELWHCLPASVGSFRRFVARVVPIALALPVSIALNNKALAYIGAGLAAIVGTLSPVCTALLSRLFGRKLALTSWLGVLIAFSGAFWACYSELRLVLAESPADASAQLNGLAFALAALATRSVRVVLQDSLLTPSAYAAAPAPPAPPGKADAIRPSGKPLLLQQQQPEEEQALTGMHLLSVQSPAVVAVATTFALLTEKPGEAMVRVNLPVSAMLLATAILATMLNVIGACVLKELGSTSMQIIGKLNAVITTAVSMAFFSESLPVAVLCGTALVLSGVGVFEAGERAAHQH